MITDEFKNRILRHVTGVRKVKTYPLTLAIQGPPGSGKSYQTNQTLVNAGYEVVRISGSDLQGAYEGEALATLKSTYSLAQTAARPGSPFPVVIIEDFDLSGAVRYDNTSYTVNWQILNNYLMNLADNILKTSSNALVRIPIFFTGNDFSRLHGPLSRHGRLDVFTWNPSLSQRIETFASMLDGFSEAEAFMIARDVADVVSDPSVASFRFALDSVRATWYHSQVQQEEKLGLAKWNEIKFVDFANIGAVELRDALKNVYLEQSPLKNFLAEEEN